MKFGEHSGRGVAADPPSIPAYGHDTLAELLPAAASLIEGSGEEDRLGLPRDLRPASRVVVYLIDGLGLDMLTEFRDTAPILAGLADMPASRSLRTCVPSTTTASIASLGTGLAPGEHGLVGYSVFVPSADMVVNLIHFTRYGSTSAGSVADVVVPEEIQPHETVLGRLCRHGIDTFTVSPAHFEDSPLTRAALRGPKFVGFDNFDTSVDVLVQVLEGGRRRLVYTYFSDLDFHGHVHGRGSDEFCDQLARADRLVGLLIDRLPARTVLFVTGDHGLLNVEEADKVDFEADKRLTSDVRALSGEPRFRHVHTVSGAEHEVLEVWRDVFSGVAWVASREEAISAGWFGPHIEPRVAPLVGDVVVAFREPVALFQPRLDNLQFRLRGHHGSFTDTESVVPLLVYCS